MGDLLGSPRVAPLFFYIFILTLGNFYVYFFPSPSLGRFVANTEHEPRITHKIQYKSKDGPWALGLLGIVRPNNYIYLLYIFLRGRFAQEGCLRKTLVGRKTGGKVS